MAASETFAHCVLLLVSDEVSYAVVKLGDDGGPSCVSEQCWDKKYITV